MKPRDYFTSERLQARRSEEPPPVLFHWTRSLANALGILEDGVIKGRPMVSTTENPAFGTPGPIVFVLSPAALLDRGFTLWPYLWQRGAETEAEWVIASDDARAGDVDHGVILSRKIAIPVQGTVRMVGYPSSWIRRRDKDIRALRLAARTMGIPVRPFSWEEWWADGVQIPR